MNTRLLSVAVPLAFIASVLHAGAPAAKEEASSFTRFVEDETGARLQTGIGIYRNKDGVTVDLVGAIHIADKAYYQKLNERFTRYEVLLYEMVGESIEKRMDWTKARDRVAAAEKSKAVPAETKVPPSESKPAEAVPGEAGSPDKAKERMAELEKYLKENHKKDLKQVEEAEQERAAGDNLAWLHPLYDTMEKSLALTGQMSGIDYSKTNFVHADMTAQQFAAMQNKKGESFLKLWWKSVQSEMAHPESVPQGPGLLKILEVLCRKDRAVELKRIVARTFGSLEGSLAGLDNEEGTVILTERNKVALAVMQQQIKLGKKNIGIFYGAAHLKDMEKRLLAMGFTRTGNEWMTAWDLPPEAPGAQSGTVDDPANGK